MNEPAHPPFYAKDRSDGFLIGTPPPSVVIHAAEPDQALNQTLGFFLETSLNILATYAGWNPTDTVVDTFNGSPAVHLIDCLGCDQEAIESRLHHIDARHSLVGKIVLFNVNAGHRTDRLSRRKDIWGIFYQNDSKSIFFEGMRTILNGRKWLKRYWTSPADFTPKVSPETPEQLLRHLTSREKEIIQMVATGMSNKAISFELEISVHSVKTHIHNIYQKLGVSNRLQAAHWAMAFCPVKS
jgi:LuxR family transcriptional regulator of csgAB operon